MIPVILSALTACPLISQGILTGNAFSYNDGAVHAFEYSIYISNPTPFSYETTRIRLWITDPSRERALPVFEEIPRTTIVPHEQGRVVHFQDATIDVRNIVGSSIECTP